MAHETFLSNWIIAEYALPFLLIFFILFAIFEKTKIFGEDKKQSDALISFVIALIFVISLSPKLIITNLILFLSVSIVIIFIGLLLWGFVSGEEAVLPEKSTKIIAGIVIVVLLFFAVLWATGYKSKFFNFWTSQNWSSSFWVNLLFIVIIAAAIAIAIKSGD